MAIPGASGSGLTELWARLRFVVIAVIVYRIGAHIPVPGINPDRLADLFEQSQGTILSSELCPETCLLYTSPSPRDRTRSRMPSSA